MPSDTGYSFLITSLFCILLLLAVSPAHSQPESFDLINAEMDGQPICGYPMDSLTTDLGRPSAVMDTEVVVSEIGPTLHYHEKGLSFRFRPGKEDPEQGLWAVTIYLSKTWDEDNSEHHLRFDGRVSKNIDADWKVEDTKSSFSGYEVTEDTPEEMKEKAEGVRMGTGEMPHAVRIQFDGHKANFAHEGTTKFLESVFLKCE